MGKRSRAKRAEEKRLARWFGITKDELGRTKVKETKAQVRRRLIREAAMQLELENAIIQRCSEEISKSIDAEVLEELTRAMEGNHEDRLSEAR